jgi:hypothetical protein
MHKVTRYPAHVAAIALIALGALYRWSAAEGARLEPFSQFLRGIETARPQDYVGAPGATVKDSATFEQMRRHLLDLYAGISVSHSFATDGQIFDCVPIDEQPGLRRQAPSAVAAPPRSPWAGARAIAGDRRLASEAQEQGCPTGTIPMRRVTLEEITRFATLRDFLAK